MSTVYTPDPTVVHSTVTIPSDGDAETAESVNAAIRDLADNAAEARSHVDGSAVDTTIGASDADTLIVNATTTFENDTTCSGFLGVGSFECNGTATFHDIVTFDGSAVTISNNCTIGSSGGDALTVNATANFSGSVTLGSTCTFNGTTTANALATFAGGVALTSKATCSAAGRIVDRPSWVLSGVGNTTIGPASGGSGDGASHMLMSSGTPTASRKLIIDDTDAVDGDWFEVTNLDATYAVSVRYPDDSNTVGSALIKTSGSPFAAKYKLIGGTWYQISYNVTA